MKLVNVQFYSTLLTKMWTLQRMQASNWNPRLDANTAGGPPCVLHFG